MNKKKEHKSLGIDKQVLRGTSLIGTAESGSPARVDVCGGKITRIRPLNYEWKYDSREFNAWTMEARGSALKPIMKTLVGPLGLAYKKRVYSKNRVRYPLKRVDWDPKGERHPENRGKSKFVRISWDEATQIIADELLRVRDTYGPEAVLSQADMHGEGKHIQPSHGCANRLLSLLGGYTIQMRNQDSWEGWSWGAKNVWGCETVGEMGPASNLYPDIAEHSDMLLFWGCDPETTPHAINGMMASRLCYWLSEIGLKSVYICPDLNYGAGVHADKWIPILPNTDAALQLAVAYMWLTEGTYEKEYIATHAVGFDRFADYVLGKEDGIPKTPAWASEKCGVKPWLIKALAREWAEKVTSIIHGNGGPMIRGPYATEPARLEAMLLGMRALGKPGVHQAKMIEWNLFSKTYALPYQSEYSPKVATFVEVVRPPRSAPDDGGRFHYNNVSRFGATDDTCAELLKPIPRSPQQSIPKCMIHDAILNPPITWWGLNSFCGPAEEQFTEYVYPAPGCSEVHMIWTDSPCWMTCWNDSYRFVEAMQSPKIECIVAQHPWLENDCLLADLILPIATRYELEDLGEDVGGGQFTSIYLEEHCVDPVGESMGDFDAVAEVARKLGLWEEYTRGVSHEKVREIFFNATGASRLMTYQELKDKQYKVMPCNPDVKDVPPGLREFYEDPKKMPLTTPTGLLEYTSTALEKHFPLDVERPPIPKWIEKGESHDERLTSERAKKYPLLCVSNHGRWRMHAQCDDITWTREIPTMKIKGYDGYLYEPVWLHPAEAEKRGIRHGDIVKVFNERGTVLGAAYVTERLIQSATYMDHGARFDPIIPGELDRGGCINCITPHNNTSKKVTGMVVSSFLVEVQKVTDAEMEGWKRDYPDAFNRNYDYTTGVTLSGWLLSEEVKHG
jgi:anaerobic selenocysteine-containing dehydrogenase